MTGIARATGASRVGHAAKRPALQPIDSTSQSKKDCSLAQHAKPIHGIKQCYTTIGQQCIGSIGQHFVMTNCYLLKRKERKFIKKEKKVGEGSCFRDGYQRPSFFALAQIWTNQRPGNIYKIVPSALANGKRRFFFLANPIKKRQNL
jgi:hypothetical protein